MGAVQSAVQVPPRCCTVMGMVKANSKRLNIRIRQEVAWQLEALAESEGISQTEVIERAILSAGSVSARPVETPKGWSIPPVVTVAEISIICRHCKEAFGGQKFQAPLCGNCKSVGHRGDLHECPVCVDYGTGAL